ncbi:recBCD enzyme subunit RecB, P-loop containing nucleoside triphosphate hydrolase [Senna tora]|uniref:RecBCD enzyme subunit RecB, P-loop containing nucleoside triphosphate hydrolase n=1 Tax=Senna tora TaxID=362788 RepID=A0A834TS23_9FABA|nr:recBCD enzyme subunit RecB, P-loop containing nucleoside triphosphate hydrolase [Senna tora]
MESESSSKKRVDRDNGFTDVMFSWSIEDILNENLYKNQVEDIELSFHSVGHYFGSYFYPLLEETRAQLSSSMETLYNAPFAEVIDLEEAKPFGTKTYDLKISSWKNRFSGRGKEPYKTLPGDVFILADFKPQTVEDLQRVGRLWSFVSVARIPHDENEDENEDGILPINLKVRSSKDIDLYDETQKSLFVVFLTNMIPNRRMWSVLHMCRSSNLIEKILCTGKTMYAGEQRKESCDQCSTQTDASRDDKFYLTSSSILNDSQHKAISACLSSLCCNHKSTIELIWGPPGTGKTNTLGTLLFALLKLKHRILACAPTNVAIKEVASRVLSMVRKSSDRESDGLFCSMGDMLLFGNHERLKVGADIEEIYLDYRVKQLTKCFAPSTGWNYSFTSMIDLLQNCISHYEIFTENELKGNENIDVGEHEKINDEKHSSCRNGSRKSFLEFLSERFDTIASPLKHCIYILCTHISKSYLLEHNFQNLVCLIEELDSFKALLFQSNIHCEELEEVFSLPESPENPTGSFVGAAHLLYKKRTECLCALRILKDSLGQLNLPNFLNEDAIKEFCFQTSLLIYSTASSSYKLHSVSMKTPLNILVIDEAAQLKECESIIPLLLPGINHAILVGDECQLPAMVESNVSYKAGFGRSLFERLSSLNHPKHLLNIQYRMHPAIIDGREEFDDAGRSRKNMVEVAVVMKIVKNLYKAWLGSTEKLCIGVVSPYAAQVFAIQEKLGHIYDSNDGFDVNVKSIDGFQGGEQDIIILSTVRSNCSSSLEFISNPQRCNVALTRARHGLWILGNEKTLTTRENVWKSLVLDAKSRQCFFNADEDMDLAKAILNVKKELDQFDDLLNSDSVLFSKSRWKVHFSDNFLKSFKKLWSDRTKKSVLSLLLKLSVGWRPKRRKVGLLCGNSSEILKQFNVESLYVVCSTDIVKESRYTQVLKIWDVLSLDDIPKLVKRLDPIFRSYTDDFITCCEKKCFEGDLEVPASWAISAEIIKFKSLDDNGNEGESSIGAFDGRSYVENSKVEESLLLMKFYSLSSGVVSHLLSNRDGVELDLPFEVTDEERHIILFPQSTFVLGRSGTGKTTVLTMKLFQKERLHHMAVERTYEAESSGAPCLSHVKEFRDNSAENSRPVLHQLFVTVSPKLCQAVKHHVTRLKRSIYGDSISAESGSADEDIVDTSIQFKNLPDSFIDLPPSSYPLVITFHKFLMMLDGTIGGMQALDSEDGRLSREEYVKLSENRGSSLSCQKRELIYDIYHNYEKMKMENGEFDLADMVIDLHVRLRTERYEGDKMLFIYIDEVQDLTMSQIALFKYICPNVDEGFVFSGDTAQTIARGIDFRFQDIRNLFYKKFVSESCSGINNLRREKGKISEIFELSQNFRTHAGVLKLSQSIIELLFHFFPHSIDLLKPETSLIYGEAPVVLESGERENAIVTIFGNSGNMGGKIVGFGAEQVILVRDDSARNSIVEYVGKQALVLTILECKGLEFQDVLLYNFFGSSPLRNRWRLIYGYMKEQEMLDTTTNISHTSFSDSKHNVLCSELKQLYVAVTRTRQRLWICENTEEFSKPMFDYWKKKCLVQTKELDDSLAQAMKVASSPAEWKSRGIKLYYQNNYEMATMCFERAGDSYWERKSKASGLKATADRLRDLNPEDASAILREAAEIFEGIGMADSAAQCFSDLGDHERAGKLYLEKCEEPDLKRAGDCFCLAGCYKIAAEVYARGSFFSDCLSVCAKGRMFDVGLGYIQHWKHDKIDGDSVVRRPELNEIEQKFLESCARHYLEHKDSKSMMKFVKAFHSMDLKRNFLQSYGLLTELLSLEEESGNFLEAVNIAKHIGDIILEAGLLEKAGNYVEASELLLFFVLANSLWSSGSKGWPLKVFEKKEDILLRALSLAKKESCSYYELVRTEADILSNELSNMLTIVTHLNNSRRYKSIRGEVLCLRKLLDAHFQLNSSKYVWQEEFIVDSLVNIEGMVSKNQLSIETLFYSWNCWRDSIVYILKYLSCLKTKSVIQNGSYGNFALNYFGVRKQMYNLNEIYILLIPDAFWVKHVSDRFLKIGKLVSVSEHILVSAALSYWCSELLTVGMDVLRNIEALHKFSANKSLSTFCQARSLVLVYEVSKFLLKCSFLTHSHSNWKSLDNLIRLPIHSLFGLAIPVDWHKPLTLNMALLRRTETCQDLAEEVINENIKRKDRLTYGQIGKVVIMILGMGRPTEGLCLEIMRRFDDNPPWKLFIESLTLKAVQKYSLGNVADKEMLIMFKFCEALQDTYNANWIREVDYISPTCFMYLIERLLILTCYWKKGLIFTTKSSFLEWLNYQDEDALKNLSLMAQVNPDLQGVHKFIGRVLLQLLYNQNDTMNWIRKSGLNVKEHWPLLVLRLVVSLCLLHLSSGTYLDSLYDLLGKSYIWELLPYAFYNVLRKGKKNLSLKKFAEAFKMVDNPLVIARIWNNSPEILCPDALLVDITISQNREQILQVLFPERVGTLCGENSAVITEASNSTDKEASPSNCSSLPKLESDMPIGIDCSWNALEQLTCQLKLSCQSLNHQLATNESCDCRNTCRKVKDCVDNCIELLTTWTTGNLQQDPCYLEDENELIELASLLDEMKQLSAKLSSSSNSVIKNEIPAINELCGRILSKRPTERNMLVQKEKEKEKENVMDKCETLQGSSASRPKENVPKDSGKGNSRENNKNGKRKKAKNNKGRNKGRK